MSWVLQTIHAIQDLAEFSKTSAAAVVCRLTTRTCKVLKDSMSCQWQAANIRISIEISLRDGVSDHC